MKSLKSVYRNLCEDQQNSNNELTLVASSVFTVLRQVMDGLNEVAVSEKYLKKLPKKYSEAPEILKIMPKYDWMKTYNELEEIYKRYIVWNKKRHNASKKALSEQWVMPIMEDTVLLPAQTVSGVSIKMRSLYDWISKFMQVMDQLKALKTPTSSEALQFFSHIDFKQLKRELATAVNTLDAMAKHKYESHGKP